MYKNFKIDGYKGSHLEHLTWGAGKAYKKEDHDKWMKQLEKDDATIYKWMCREENEVRARAQFDTTSKCEHITNKFSESFIRYY